MGSIHTRAQPIFWGAVLFLTFIIPNLIEAFCLPIAWIQFLGGDQKMGKINPPVHLLKSCPVFLETGIWDEWV
jgi:hypothetical protein